MRNLCFVVTREVLHPETYEPLLAVGDCLLVDAFEFFNRTLGIDHIPCEVCMSEFALANAQKRLCPEVEQF